MSHAQEVRQAVRVVNQCDVGYVGTYVGRPSLLGNPYLIGRHGTREVVVEKYRNWLRDQWRMKTPAKDALLGLVALYKAEGQLTLRCFCAPKACHAHVRAEAIEKIAARS
jgi:hypothetical protein